MERITTTKTHSTKEINRRLGRIYEIALRAYHRSKGMTPDSQNEPERKPHDANHEEADSRRN